MPAAGKCALRWRGAVRLSAELRRTLPAEQLLTLRYEDLVLKPAQAVATLTDFLETRVSKVPLYGHAAKAGSWRARLRPDDLALVEKVAREELKRLGYQ
jgi:hypothetical protein